MNLAYVVGHPVEDDEALASLGVTRVSLLSSRVARPLKSFTTLQVTPIRRANTNRTGDHS